MNQPTSEYSALAQKLDELLQALSGELDASMNPHRIALRQLGINRDGWTLEPYNDEAFKIWSKLLQRNGDEDIETLHHMAIMHHARAIDLEGSKNPQKADADWKTAMDYWYRLWKSDAFWTRIAETASKMNPNGIHELKNKLREKFPELLLRIHYDIAFHEQTMNYRARYHIRIALESPFSDESKDNVRRDVYEQFVSDLPSRIWRSDTLDTELIEQGIERIKRYLELDPGCIIALVDAIGLQNRLLIAQSHELTAVEKDRQAKRISLLRSIKRAGDYWRKYFDQLVDVAHTLDEDTRHKLSLWYRVNGEVLFALDKYEDAIVFYEQGIKAGIEDNDEWQQCLKNLGETHAFLAREYVLKGDSRARAYCDNVRKRNNLSINAHFLLANAYKLLHDYDTAEEVCYAGLSIEYSIDEWDAIKNLKDMLDSVLHERKIHKLFKEAKEYMETEHFSQALLLLDQVLEISPEDDAAYFLRCQCHFALDNIDEAKSDLKNFKRYCTDLEGVHEIVVDIEKTIEEKEALLRKFGPRALELRLQSTMAYNNKQYQRASDLLRQAIASCLPPGRKEIEKELAIVLCNWAIGDVNRVLEDKFVSNSTKKRICREALLLLEEANRLDPDNSFILENLNRLRDILLVLDKP